jgi:hypothetical protein
MTPDWAALRRLLRPWAIGMIIWLAFLAVWQFLVPAGKSRGSSSGGALDLGLLVGALAVLVPTSLVLAFAATRRLWRARRRLVALLPIPLLCALTWALPTLSDDAGLERVISIWMVPSALLLSSVVSAAFIVFSASPPEPPSDPGMDGWSKAA